MVNYGNSLVFEIGNKRLATVTICCSENGDINMQQKVQKIRIMSTNDRETYSRKTTKHHKDNGRQRMTNKQNWRQFKFVPILNGEI